MEKSRIRYGMKQVQALGPLTSRPILLIYSQES